MKTPWRIANLLLKLKRHQRKLEALENAPSCHYVPDKKGVSDFQQNS
jgi:hypothetical protein